VDPDCTNAFLKVSWTKTKQNVFVYTRVFGLFSPVLSNVFLWKHATLFYAFSSNVNAKTQNTDGNSGVYRLLTKCEVKMAGYWPSSFFACLWTETESRSIRTVNIQPSWPSLDHLTIFDFTIETVFESLSFHQPSSLILLMTICENTSKVSVFVWKRITVASEYKQKTSLKI